MRTKILAAVTALILASLVSVGAFASQDGVSMHGHEAPAAASHGGGHAEGDNPRGIPDDNPSHAPDAGGACDKGETAIKTTPGGNRVMVPCHAANNNGGSAANGQHDNLHGIPNDNPSHKPDAGGACDKGETAIKTTPGGNRVMVPCHAAAHEHGPN